MRGCSRREELERACTPESCWACWMTGSLPLFQRVTPLRAGGSAGSCMLALFGKSREGCKSSTALHILCPPGTLVAQVGLHEGI